MRQNKCISNANVLIFVRIQSTFKHLLLILTSKKYEAFINHSGSSNIIVWL